jgi:hypothetical protein
MLELAERQRASLPLMPDPETSPREFAAWMQRHAMTVDEIDKRWPGAAKLYGTRQVRSSSRTAAAGRKNVERHHDLVYSLVRDEVQGPRPKWTAISDRLLRDHALDVSPNQLRMIVRTRLGNAHD